MPKMIKGKLAAHLTFLEEQRERMTLECYDIQRTGDPRVVGPVIAAFGTILTYLDEEILRCEKRMVD
jgi:hypothetical protein